jgi:hypothetical protein
MRIVNYFIVCPFQQFIQFRLYRACSWRSFSITLLTECGSEKNKDEEWKEKK